MRRWLVVLVLLGCGASNQREIRKTEVNTEDARLTGFMEDIQGNDCAPLCSSDLRDVDVEREAVEDEAHLVEVGGSACADVRVRAVVDFDAPLGGLHPSCAIDGHEVAAAVLDERFDVVEFDGESSVVVAQGVVDADVVSAHGLSAAAYYSGPGYSADRLRVVERQARLCCPGAPEHSMSIQLTNEIHTEFPQGLEFLWIFVE